jgi:type I restriction enzyme R subunit
LRELLRRKGPGLVFGMIQKQRGDAVGEPGLKEDLPPAEMSAPKAPGYGEVLNDDDSILVLVDEAHRSQAGDLQAALQAGSPTARASASPARRS